MPSSYLLVGLCYLLLILLLINLGIASTGTCMVLNVAIQEKYILYST